MQASKAGLLEVADVFVINKSDRPGGARPVATWNRCSTCRGPAHGAPRSSTPRRRKGEGVGDLWHAVARHRDHLESAGQLTRGGRIGWRRSCAGCCSRAWRPASHELAAGEEFTTAVKALTAGELDPYQAADRLLTE